MRASSISPRTRPCRAHERKSRQGHARRYKTVRATLSNPFSHCTFSTNETCKFRSERRLRVSAKYLIRRSGISPPSRLVTRSAPAPRERKKVYHKSPPLWGKRWLPAAYFVPENAMWLSGTKYPCWSFSCPLVNCHVFIRVISPLPGGSSHHVKVTICALPA